MCKFLRRAPESSVSVIPFLFLADVQVYSIDELKQQKNYMKLLKKQNKELKELQKKHLKKVHTYKSRGHPIYLLRFFGKCLKLWSWAGNSQTQFVFLVCRCGI